MAEFDYTQINVQSALDILDSKIDNLFTEAEAIAATVVFNRSSQELDEWISKLQVLSGQIKAVENDKNTVKSFIEKNFLIV